MEILGRVPRVVPGRQSVQEQQELVSAFTQTRRALRHCFPTGESVAFEVTSDQAQAGTSFVSANLALAFAEAGFQTVLVDAGASRPGVSASLGVSHAPGLADYLRRGSGPLEIVRQTAYDRLAVVPFGVASGAALDDASAQGRALAAALQMRFDVTIVDRSAEDSSDVTDAARAMSHARLLVSRFDSTGEPIPARDVATGGAPDVRILGVVLNGATRLR